jgi:hypothetical protein
MFGEIVWLFGGSRGQMERRVWINPWRAGKTASAGGLLEAELLDPVADLIAVEP